MISIEHIATSLAKQKKRYDINKNAAILIPIVKDKSGQLNLLFQIRSLKLRWQPGDICFPGGRMENIDLSPIDTAIRETHEELGVSMSSIKVYGQLPLVTSRIGLNIYPVIGELTSQEYNINKNEVAEIFTVPINWFYNNPPLKSSIEIIHRPAINFPYELVPQYDKEWHKQSKYDVFFYCYGKYTIWGLTAQIIQSFLETIY